MEIAEEVRRERDRCVRICRRRAELWRKTSAAPGSTAAREEARARANEALYLADLLATGDDLTADP